MDKLRHYLNSLSPDQQAAYADRCGTSIGYLRKACTTRPQLDGALCRKLDEESAGEVPRASLRPDIWPEETA
jgi:DNA-binding transcriptional regulator YdaS (Cro superfamily)